MINRLITHALRNQLSQCDHGSMTLITPDGATHRVEGVNQGATAHVTLMDWGVAGLLIRKGDIGLAEAYRDGRLECPDLTQLFLFGMQNQSVMSRVVYGGKMGMMWSRLQYWMNRNTPSGSKQNIHAHYDIGNAFYRLWLDASMTYSSALFHHDADSLVTAQQQKYDRIIDRMGQSGSVLEIGCGWGGFAERALQKGDFELKGLTISDEQFAYATERLAGNATIALEDYRHQQGWYQHIVSIEMFEAVGEAYWPTYFQTIKRLLAKGGKAMIQTIDIADDCFERYRTTGDAIRTFIFPGGMLPSKSRFQFEAQQAGLQVTDRFSFGLDYAKTLGIWLAQFESVIDDLVGMGFDQPFIRMWRFYLTCCMAGFLHQRTDVCQWELCHS